MFNECDNMRKNIKITQKQYRMLLEMDEYVSNSDVKPYDGYGGITVDGKMDGETNGENVLTGDKQAGMECPSIGRYFGNRTSTLIREFSTSTNKEDNTADDWGETDAIDDNRLEDPNSVKIPNTVQEKVNMFINVLNKQNLNDEQKTVVLNYIRPRITSNRNNGNTSDNKLENPKRVQIPYEVKRCANILLQEMNKIKMDDMKKAKILNTIMPHLTSDSTTYHSQRRTDIELQKSNLNVTNAVKKNIANNA